MLEPNCGPHSEIHKQDRLRDQLARAKNRDTAPTAVSLLFRYVEVSSMSAAALAGAAGTAIASAGVFALLFLLDQIANDQGNNSSQRGRDQNSSKHTITPLDEIDGEWR